VFIASSWKKIVRRRGKFYAALASTWSIPAVFLCTKSAEYASNGVFLVKGVSPWTYALSQPGVLLRYLRLCLWPTGQCLDYGWPVARTASEIVPPMLGIGLLLAVTIWCVFSRPRWGFLGGWFFVILAPTSSVAPLADLAFEHRMYLPLAAVVVAAVMAGEKLRQYLTSRVKEGTRWDSAGLGVTMIAAVVLLASLTHFRNQTYQTRVSLWRDVVQKASHHARGHYNLGAALVEEGDFLEAERQYRGALRIAPQDAMVHWGLGVLEDRRGRCDLAVKEYHKALDLNPRCAKAYHGLGLIAERQGQVSDAARYYRSALKIAPDYVEVHCRLASLIGETQPDVAITHYGIVAKLDPRHVDAQYNLGVLWERQGDANKALSQYEKTLSLAPNRADAHLNAGRLLAAGNPGAAIRHYRAALQIDPRNAEAHNNLGALLGSQRRSDEAVAEFREAIRIRPEYVSAHLNLACVLAKQGNEREAARHLHVALRLSPEAASKAKKNAGLARLWEQFPAAP
jgi:tetratricopeptide (TPR) repeat protein